MEHNYKKLTEEVAAVMRTHIKAFEPEKDLETLTYKDIFEGTSEKAKKVQQDNGTFDVIISVESVDRAGEIVRQDGWDMKNYKNNPIVLWGHDYYSLGIGVCLETYNTTYKGMPALGARGVFYSGDINALAQQVRKMYDFGLKMGVGAGCTTSVGFIPKEFDPNDQNVITRAELLEFSFVPVPAQQDVGPAAGRMLTYEEAKEIGLDTFALRAKGLSFKATEIGASCTMPDGTPGVLISDPSDPKGALICQPQDSDKSAKESTAGDDDNGSTMQKAIDVEHGRHMLAKTKALDEFKAAVAPEQGDAGGGEGGDEDDAPDSGPMKKALKGLANKMGEEHDMHRTKNVEIFRMYAPSSAEKKDFDIEKHMKALKAEHKDYDSKCDKDLDKFEEKCMKSFKSVEGEGGPNDEHIAWITGKMQAAGDAHLKGVTKCAKAMNGEFGEGEEKEEKEIEVAITILSEMLENETLGEAHKYLKAAMAVLGVTDIGDGSGEAEPADTEAPAKERSTPGGPASAREKTESILAAREIVRGISTVVTAALEDFNTQLRIKNKKP